MCYGVQSHYYYRSALLVYRIVCKLKTCYSHIWPNYWTLIVKSTVAHFSFTSILRLAKYLHTLYFGEFIQHMLRSRTHTHTSIRLPFVLFHDTSYEALFQCLYHKSHHAFWFYRFPPYSPSHSFFSLAFLSLSSSHMHKAVRRVFPSYFI